MYIIALKIELMSVKSGGNVALGHISAQWINTPSFLGNYRSVVLTHFIEAELLNWHSCHVLIFHTAVFSA